MGTTSSYQSSTTKLPGDSIAKAWYTNSKGYRWAKYEDLTDNELVIKLEPGKHVRYPTKEDDDFCLVSSEKYGMNVYRNTPEQIEAFWASRQGSGGVGQQKTVASLKPPVQERPPDSLFPQKQAQSQAQPPAQTAQVSPNNDDVPASRAAVMLKWNFWEDKDGLDLLRRNNDAGWVVEKLDSRNDGHLVLMRRKQP